MTSFTYYSSLDYAFLSNFLILLTVFISKCTSLRLGHIAKQTQFLVLKKIGSLFEPIGIIWCILAVLIRQYKHSCLPCCQGDISFQASDLDRCYKWKQDCNNGTRNQSLVLSFYIVYKQNKQYELQHFEDQRSNK